MRIVFLFIIVASMLSCSKKEDLNPSIDSTLLHGRWLEISNFGQTEYSKTNRFGDFEKGIVFFDDGTLISRSESTVCIGENCLMENYIGTWSRSSYDIINISSESLKGEQSFEYEIIELTKDKLRVERK